MLPILRLTGIFDLPSANSAARDATSPELTLTLLTIRGGGECIPSPSILLTLELVLALGSGESAALALATDEARLCPLPGRGILLPEPGRPGER